MSALEGIARNFKISTSTPSILCCILLLTTASQAQDSWETLPDVPFPYGVSAGGGLATDGTFLYAADFSGDGNNDFIDEDDNGAYTPGEWLQELGIPNGSVRFARFNPAAGNWDLLPALNPDGVGGDAFSFGNLTGGLFYGGGSLFYYQFRGGPNRCALYRYNLANGLEGGWLAVWDLSTSEALISVNGGLVGVDAPGGPTILHHKGGGAYEFARSTGLINGLPDHALLTPAWPYTGAHFPRNGSWAYDTAQGRLFHMSGDQLIQWEPSAAYAPQGFLEAIPNGADDLAVPATTIASLKTTLGWNPGGEPTHPGASLWGNAIVVVNDPSGFPGGPDGEDTGANVLYLVRGETSADGWPFNEGRGVVNNGDFARYFPATGAAQNLPPAPFHIGKGSAAGYVNGAVYVLQGETRNSPDTPGNAGPLNSDGIRRPGMGFARFLIKSSAVTGSPIIPVGDYLVAGFATLDAPADAGTGPDPLFDQNWHSLFQAATANPADIIIGFPSATAVGAARGRFGEATHEWFLDAADSLADLANGIGSFTRLFGPVAVASSEMAWREWNDTPVSRRYFRFRISRPGGGIVEIRELELQRPKPVQTVMIDGAPVQINHLEITPANPTMLVGGSIVFTAEASLSLGPERYNVTTQAVWSSSSSKVASAGPDGTTMGHAAGEIQISADFEGLMASTRLNVATITEQDDDISVAWIQRLPSQSYVWGSTNANRDGWPQEGSNVTWRALVKNWHPFTRTNVSYHWSVDGTTVASGNVNLASQAWTGVDLVRPWSFTRESIRFEIDHDQTIAEFSESNNVVSTWTDAITVGFWVEQSVYDYFHEHQHQLGDGANGWEDWAQRQVARWNQMFAAAVHPVDAPQGVLDRIRLDKVTIVPDGALPLAGGLPSNNPDNNDRTTDLVWGFPATLLDGSFYANHTHPSDDNAFYYEGSLIHELGHARYLIDAYGFNVSDRADNPRVHVQHQGQPIAGTPWLPRSYPWWDHVHIIRPGMGNPFEGLMSSPYTRMDRYSAMAMNLIAGHRAVRGNYNAPGNIGVFRHDLPAANQIQILDGQGRPVGDGTVKIYRATGTSDWYGKQFDDIPDLTFTADALGRVEVGQNPFADGPLQHTYGISTMVALVKVEADGRAGFAFLKAGLLNMEYWRGNTNQGRYSLQVPMVGSPREIAAVNSWPEDNAWRVQVIAGGDAQPQSVQVDGQSAFYQEGSWWVRVTGGVGERLIEATWPDGPTVEYRTHIPTAPIPLALAVQTVSGPPAELRMTWPSLLGCAYEIETSTNLLTWRPALSGHLFGTAEPLVHAEPLIPSQSFYRVVVHRLGN